MCNSCWKIVENHTEDLNNVMKLYDHEKLAEKIKYLNLANIEIDVKIFEKANVLLEKLQTQNKIKNYISSLKVVDDYKTILKSVNIINEYHDDAMKRFI